MLSESIPTVQADPIEDFVLYLYELKCVLDTLDTIVEDVRNTYEGLMSLGLAPMQSESASD